MVPLVTSASSYYLSTTLYCILLYITDPERRKYGAFGYLACLSTTLYCILLYITDPERRKYGAFGYLGLLILLINNIILYITVYYRPREKEVWCLWLPWPPDPAYQQHYTVYYCILQTQREGSMVPLVTSASSYYLSTTLYCILLYITDPERRKYGAFGYLGLLILLINNIILYITVYYRPREKEVWCLWLPRPPHPAYQQHYTVYYCILQTQREGSMVPLVTLASSFCLSTTLYCILLYITDPERRKYGAFGYLGLLILLINNIILYITVYYRPREKEVWCLWLPWPPHSAYQQHYTVYYCILQTQREGSMVPLVTLASSFCLSTTLYCILLYITDPERRKYGAFGYLGLLILLINNIILYITVYYRPREKEVWCLWLPWPPHSTYQQHYTVYYCILQTQREGSMVPLVTSAS